MVDASRRSLRAVRQWPAFPRAEPLRLWKDPVVWICPSLLTWGRISSSPRPRNYPEFHGKCADIGASCRLYLLLKRPAPRRPETASGAKRRAFLDPCRNLSSTAALYRLQKRHPPPDIPRVSITAPAGIPSRWGFHFAASCRGCLGCRTRRSVAIMRRVPAALNAAQWVQPKIGCSPRCYDSGTACSG